MSNPKVLAEALAWLDYCLGEAEAAMQAVKAAAAPDLTGTTDMNYHEICESAARITTLRGRAAGWRRGPRS